MLPGDAELAEVGRRAAHRGNAPTTDTAVDAGASVNASGTAVSALASAPGALAIT